MDTRHYCRMYLVIISSTESFAIIIAAESNLVGIFYKHYYGQMGLVSPSRRGETPI